MNAITRAALFLAAFAASACGATPAPIDLPKPPPPPVFPADIAIRLGRLVNPADGRVIERAVILVKGDRITYVGQDAEAIPKGAEVVDWSRYTGLPGLIDAHTHIGFVSDDIPGITPWERMDELDDATSLRLAREHAFAGLRIGVTTMIDKGCRTGIDRKLKREIEAGVTPGPRLFLASEGIDRAAPNSTERKRGKVISSSEFVPEVQREVKDGSDLIKLWSDWCSDRAVECQQTISYDEMKSAIDEAHRLGKHVAIHAYHGTAAKDAVFAGTDSVEHPAELDKETIDEMVKRGTVYVPTIDHNRYYNDNAALYGMSHLEMGALSSYLEHNLEAVRAAHEAGVRIAMGSDAVFNMFGQNTRELAWLVRAGMTPLEALRAATVNGAFSIGEDREIGSVSPGYFADIIAVEGDPLADIQVVIEKVRGVMVGGRVLIPPQPAKAPPPTPESEPLALPDIPSGADAARDAELAKQAKGILEVFTNSNADFVPGGTKIVFVSDRDGLPQLYLGDAKAPAAAPLRLVNTTDRIANPRATPDGKSVIFRSDRQRSGNWSYYRVDIDGKNLVELTPGVEMERDAPFVSRSASPPILVYAASTSSFSEWRRRVFTLDLTPGSKPKQIYISPWPGSITDVSSDGKWALLTEHRSPTMSAVSLVNLASGAVKTLYPAGAKEIALFDAVFTEDAKRFVVAIDDGGEKVGLVQIDIATGEEKAHTTLDLPAAPAGVGLASSAKGDKIAVRVTTGDHTSIRLMDPKTLKSVRELKIPLGVGVTGDFSADGKRISISFSTASQPTTIYAADTSTGELVPLRRDALPSLAGLPPIEASITEISSFDGTKIPVNLYLPAAGKGKIAPSPVMLMIHKGPAESAETGWDGMRRFYAAQGYAIVEPNLRGSTGFGRAFTLADNDRKRVDAIKDMEAVARWIAAQPWANKSRIVIFGADYGGYMALLGLEKQSEIFRAGVDLYGVPSLRSLLASRAGSNLTLAAEFGDLERDGEFLDSISPLQGAAALRAPLFVYTSTTDPRAPRREHDQIVAALRNKSVPVEYMTVTDEGHTLHRIENQIQVLARSARFLERATADKSAAPAAR